MKKIVQSILFVSFAILGLQYCQNPSEDSTSAVVNPPFKGVDVSYQLFELEATAGKTIKLENGTSIVIPADIFVDKEENPIRGKVFLKYREFHNAAQIIASGITMKYDSAGTNHFETAGMFELQGYTKMPDRAQIIPTQSDNEKPVFIAEGKSIEVNMASFAEDDNYNFYYLDNNTRNWVYKGYSSASKNAEKIALLDELAPVPTKPIPPKNATSDMQVFDLQLNPNKYPDFSSLQSVLWQYVGDDANSPYKAGNEWMFQSEKKNLSINPSDEAEGQYTISFTANGQLVNLEAVPVFSGVKNQKKALRKFEKKMEDYEKALQKRREEEARRMAEANLIRSFKINNFGIYNHDRLWGAQSAITFAATFKAGEENLEQATVFLIPGDGRGLIEYKNYDWKQFRYDPKEKNRLLAVLTNNQVATFSSEQFEQLDIKAGSDYTFQLNIENEVTSLKNVSDILAKL